MIKMALKTRRCCAVPSCGKKMSLLCLSSAPNIRKFIFNEDPDHVSKNSSSFPFFLQRIRLQTRHNSIFKKIETKRRCCVKYIESDSNFTTHKCNCFYYVVTFAWSVITDCLIYIELCIFDLNHSSIHLLALFHCMVRHGTVRFTFGGFSTGYCTWYLILF